jgi:SAM-dependent methyltransferase
MRPRHVIYGDLLRFQAELSADLELPFFYSASEWEHATTILDLGSGNGYYAARLAGVFPDKTFVCLERDPKMAGQASRWATNGSLTSITGTLSDLPNETHFSFVLARHTLSYLDDLPAFGTWLTEHTTHGAGLLVIDADDDAFLCRPPLPILERGNEEFKKKVAAAGGDRDVVTRLREHVHGAGFSHRWTRGLIVHSDIRDRKYLMYMFMRAVAEYDHGSPLPSDVWSEIDAWALDPHSYLQYGLAASLFARAP